MKIYYTGLFLILIFSCKQSLQEKELDTLLDPSIGELEHDFQNQTRRLEKGIQDRGNKPSEKAFLDSIALFDSIIHDYQKSILSEKTSNPEILQQELNNASKGLSALLGKPLTDLLKEEIDSSEFFRNKNQTLELVFTQISDKDFLMYKKFLSMEWMLIAVKVKAKVSQEFIKSFEWNQNGAFLPLVKANKNVLQTGESLMIDFAGYNYVKKDLTFRVDGKEIFAKDGIADITLGKALRGKTRISKYTVNIELPMNMYGYDTILTEHSDYYIQSCK